MCSSFLELAPLNFWVDELQEISSDVVALKAMSQLLVFLIFLKNCKDFAKNCSLADLYLTESAEGHLSRGVRVINKMKLMRCTFILKNVINCTGESRTVSSFNRYTRNKNIFHSELKTFFSNIQYTFGDKIFISFCIDVSFLPIYRTAIYVLTFLSFKVGWV